MAFSKGTWGGLIIDDPAADVGVLGVPFDGAVCVKRGASFAPAKLRELSSNLACSTEEGHPLIIRAHDYGDVPVDLEWERYFETIERQAAEVLRHPLALFLGGDHSVTIPIMRAFNTAVEGPFGILHFDAHPDLFDIFEGHRWSHACTLRRALELSGAAPERMVSVGLRSICREEKEFLEAHPNLTTFTARQIYRRGIKSIANETIYRLREVPVVYFTLDIDGLDPAYAPGTGIPEAGGPSTLELLEFIQTVFQGLPIAAMDVVEVAPPLDENDITSYAALKLIYEAWGAFQAKRINDQKEE
jgi:agmatinase